MNSSRRDFLKTSGCLTIGFFIASPADVFSGTTKQELPESLKRHPNINAWVQILPDGTVRIFTGKLELGQGIRTAIAQVAAEELDHDIHKVEVVLADTDLTPDEGYTAGSGSMEQSAMAVRFASAAAKAKLLQIASVKLKTPPETLVLGNGEVQTKNGGSRISFAEIIGGQQITDKVRDDVQLKPKDKYQLVGKAIPRDDISKMVRGTAAYVQDLRFPGMVHARVVRPPGYSSRLEKIDEETVRKQVPSIRKIVKNGSFLAVIADDEYQAVRAQQAMRLACRWTENSFKPESERKLPSYLKSAPANTDRIHEQGSIANQTLTHKASYYKPYLMHGSVGPSCAVALWTDNRLQVWTHSQGVFPLRGALAGLLKIPAENIRVTGVPGSGCYGHNGADDVAADAAIIAMAYPGKHVRLQWSREDEHLWEPYGSAMLMEASASLDSSGKITHWKYDLWSDNHSTRPGGKAANLLAARYVDNPFDPPSGGYGGGAYRNSQPYYDIPNQQIDGHQVKGPLRISALRSLGAYANIFAIESFMDELAVAAKKDPFDFRLMHLTDPRAIDVVKKLREVIKNEKISDGEGIGIAFSRYKNSASYCAAAAKIAVDNTAQKLRVQKMWAVIDAGESINIDGVINQTEGGLVQAASWTLIEEVKFDNKHLTGTDWSTYPIMRAADAPETAVHVINRPSEEVLGAGEAAQGPAAAAIANALYRATGKRVRELPYSQQRLFGKEM